ncbi:MAG: hypothetical protein AAGD32_17635 [Planctomycetota bacterium]
MTKLLILIALLLPATTVLAQDPAEPEPAAEVEVIESEADTESTDEAAEAETEAETEAAQTDEGDTEEEAPESTRVTLGDFNIWLTIMWVSVLGIPLVITLFFIATVRYKKK